MASGSGWNLWVWLLGVGIYSPHTTYPYSSCICSFTAASLLFVHFSKCFSFLFIVIYQAVRCAVKVLNVST